MRTQRRGFTIIELLVVILIIGLLIGIASTNYLTAQRHARDSVRKSTVHSIASAVESYYAVQRKLPGKIDIQNSNLPGGFDAPSYNTTHLDCQRIDTSTVSPSNSSSTIVYLYKPLQTCSSDPNVGDLTNVTSGFYNAADYQNPSGWIPGMAPYLNPVPIELRYQGSNGSSTSEPGEDFTATDTGSDQTRTYAYRHLVNGYAVYTRLESTGNTDTVQTGDNLTDTPAFPVDAASSQPLQSTSQQVFMVRK